MPLVEAVSSRNSIGKNMFFCYFAMQPNYLFQWMKPSLKVMIFLQKIDKARHHITTPLAGGGVGGGPTLISFHFSACFSTRTASQIDCRKFQRNTCFHLQSTWTLIITKGIHNNLVSDFLEDGLPMFKCFHGGTIIYAAVKIKCFRIVRK